MEIYVFACRRHGQRTEDQVYRSNDKSTILGYRYKCKECTYLASSKRPCKVHGDVPQEDRMASGKCRICELTKFHSWNNKRNNNRADFNEKQRLKREANPEWAKEQRKKEYQNHLKNHGSEYLNDNNKARSKGLTIDQYKQMFIDQNNLCAICNQPETRIFKYRDKEKGMKISKLCIDHCHKSELEGIMKVRGLLCHDCNTMLGKAKDNIQILQSAIDYLNKHQN